MNEIFYYSGIVFWGLIGALVFALAVYKKDMDKFYESESDMWEDLR